MNEINEAAKNKHPSRRGETGRNPLHQMPSPEEAGHR
jgi:hypothetical protein